MSMMPLTAAFVVSNRTIWEQAHACIQNLPVRLAVEQGMEQTDPSEADAVLDRIERHRVDVVFVEASRIALPLEEFVRRVRNTPSQPAVFVLNPDASPELILEALRAGANEYLYPPLADTLRDALQRLSAARSKGGSETSNALGKIYGFLSACGGCGATTIAVHLAPDLARQMKEATLLADFDFDAGLLRFLMKAKTTYSVRDAIDNLHRMDSSLWKGLVSSLPDKLDVMPAPDEVAAKRAPGREEMTHLMRFIRSTYQLSLIDFGRSVSVAALDSLPELETLYLVTTPHPTALERANRAIQIIESRGFNGQRLKVLLNCAEDRKKHELETIERALGHPVEAVFRNDHLSLYDAYSEGRFLPPANALAKEFHALAESIRLQSLGERSRDKKESIPAPAAAGGKGWLSFLHKVPGFQKDQGQRLHT
jgi:pilus assembly protein CpaE